MCARAKLGWSDDTSVDVRRWLRGSAARVRELAFLRELGERGEVASWPRRVATRHPATVRQGRWPREEWRRVIGELGAVGIEWDDVALGVSRGADVAAPTRAGNLHVHVGALLFDGGRCVVFASASPIPDPLVALVLGYVTPSRSRRRQGARSELRPPFDAKLGDERSDTATQREADVVEVRRARDGHAVVRCEHHFCSQAADRASHRCGDNLAKLVNDGVSRQQQHRPALVWRSKRVPTDFTALHSRIRPILRRPTPGAPLRPRTPPA
jgi:hypothetical protein